MRQEVKNQHYIPQFYLRKFGKSGKSSKKIIYIFNKKTLDISEKMIKRTASKNNFYDFEKEFLENYSEDIKQIFEETFGKIEEEVSKIFNKIEKLIKDIPEDINLKTIEFSNKDKSWFSEFLEAQYIRTDYMRKCISILNKQSLNEVFDLYAKKNEELNELKERYNLSMNIDEKGKKFLHLQFMINTYKNHDLIKYFFNRQWIFLKNNSEKTFYTSDNPINLIRIGYSPWGIGPATADIILFPINPRILLCMYSKNYLQKIGENLDLEKVYIKNIFDTKTVINHNFEQINNADEEIYSFENDFEIIRKIIKENEEEMKKSPSERIR